MGPNNRRAVLAVLSAGIATTVGFWTPAAIGLVQTTGVEASFETSPIPTAWPEDPQPSFDDDFLLFLELLCIVLRCEDPAQPMGLSPVAARADYFMSTYRNEGLLPNLTEQEIQEGLHAASTTRDYLHRGVGTPGSLGASRAAELDRMLSDLIQELSSRRDPSVGALPGTR
ncbi:MAG: hypothetical protein GIKADHBN_02987 [Phycisphaerales bacterium]|nr:hypothetical protein [Phycisphaerales bacterium]